MLDALTLVTGTRAGNHEDTNATSTAAPKRAIGTNGTNKRRHTSANA